MRRRGFLKWLIASCAITAAVSPASLLAQGVSAPKEIRIGYQKNGVLVIARQQAALEKHFSGRGIQVKWVEFSSGPPMLEAMSAGSVDFGAVGDSPPIFAQAANANIVYAAAQPITNGQGILVPASSTIRSGVEEFLWNIVGLRDVAGLGGFPRRQSGEMHQRLQSVFSLCREHAVESSFTPCAGALKKIRRRQVIY